MTDQKHLPPRGEAPCPNCSYEAAPPPLDGLREALELAVKNIPPTVWSKLDDATKRVLWAALRDEGETT